MYHITTDGDIEDIDIQGQFHDMAMSAMRDIGLPEDEAEAMLEDYQFSLF